MSDCVSRGTHTGIAESGMEIDKVHRGRFTDIVLVRDHIVHYVVRMTQAYIGVLRKVGYRAPQPKSPIGIRSSISDYVGPGSTPENF